MSTQGEDEEYDMLFGDNMNEWSKDQLQPRHLLMMSLRIPKIA